MRGPVDITRELIDAGVAHEIVHLRRRIDDAAELPEVLGLPGTSCVAVRLYDVAREPGGARVAPGLAAALVPADTVPATTALARALRAGAVRPTPAARVSAVTDHHPSLVPPVGLPPDVALVADAALRDQEVVYAATGDGGTALKVRAGDLLGLLRPLVAGLVEPGAAWASADGPRPVEGSWRGTPVPAPATLRR
jgi:prolyl-tRNA editing enzyme YbaK/EbsC (Cys-tRNA(Pro) deacylase)